MNNSQLASLTPAKAGSKPAYGGSTSPCGQLMKHQPVQVVYGPGTFLNRAVAAVNAQVRALVANAQTAITNAQSRAYTLATSRGLSKAQAEKAATSAGTLQRQQELQQLEQLYLQLGDLRDAVDRRPAVHPRDRVRPHARRQPAQGAVRLPVPQLGLGADPGQAEGLAVRRPAASGDPLDPPGGGTADVPPGQRRYLHGERRPGRDQRSRLGHHRLDLEAADRGATGDGGGAADGVPQPPAAAAARRSRWRPWGSRSASPRWRAPR